MTLEKTIEALIKKAQAQGDFDNLPGHGKPIDLTEYFNAPEDIRVAQSLLKGAGMVPVEVELLKRIAILKETLQTTNDASRADAIRQQIKEKQLQLNLLIEHRR